MSRAKRSTPESMLHLNNQTSCTGADCSPDIGDAEAAREHEVGLIRTGVLELDAPQRTVLALYYFEGLTVDQIGGVLDLAASDVAHLRTVALKSLQGTLTQRAA
ncbi:MAG: sigma factor-like helix-turn-helix DNA-binding protein [Gemmatimonadaceae bacterium]